MSLFELDGGRLVPAQFGRTVPTGLTEEILESVRSQVLEIIARPLFPITWRDMSRQPEASVDIPRLTALDATGQVVSVEVLDHLTSDALINSLSRLADIAALSWTDLALEYPGGVPAFRSGWLMFRDSMPPSPGAGPRLIMVVGSIDPAARAALEVLTASGVEVHELSYRQMSNGRAFLDVNPVGPRVYAHTPQLLSAGSDVAQIEQAKRASASTELHSPVEHSAVPVGDSGQIPAADVPPQVPVVDAEAKRVAPHSSSINIALDEDPREFRRSSPVYPRVRRSDAERQLRASSVREQPLFLSRRQHQGERVSLRGDSAQVDEVAVALAAHEAAAYSSVDAVSVPGVEREDALGRDFVALQAMAVVVGDDTPLYVRPSLDVALPMEFAASGHIRVGVHEFTDPDEALEANGVAGVDAWEELRLMDPFGPSLADALRELNSDIARQYQAKH